MSEAFRNSCTLSLTLVFCLFFGLAAPSRAAAQQIIINAVGDIMLAGRGTDTYARMGYDYPFASVIHELKAGDITVGNLEAPITRHGTEFKNKKFRFRISPRATHALQGACFSVLTLANNHTMDFGAVGLKETLRHLDRANILHTGAGENLAMARKPALVRVGEQKIAFLAYSLTLPSEFYAGRSHAGTSPGLGSYYTEDIASARSGADYVVVSFHWGTEGATTPKPYQVLAAHRAIDAGADIVIGHHPHVLQGIEWYKGGVIFYSLGNFAFGSMSRSSDVSAIARIKIDNGIEEVEVIPLNVLNGEVRFQPKVLNGERGLAAMRRLAHLSKPLGTEIQSDGRRYLAHKTGKRYRLARY